MRSSVVRIDWLDSLAPDPGLISLSLSLPPTPPLRSPLPSLEEPGSSRTRIDSIIVTRTTLVERKTQKLVEACTTYEEDDLHFWDMDCHLFLIINIRNFECLVILQDWNRLYAISWEKALIGDDVYISFCLLDASRPCFPFGSQGFWEFSRELQIRLKEGVL